MTGMSPSDARDFIKLEIAALEADCEPIITVSTGPRLAARSLDWWYEGENIEDEGSITKRTTAYLRTYVAAAGQKRLFAIGIPLSKGRLWMDKYVIRRLHADGYLTYVEGFEPYFEPTDAGERLLEAGQ